MANKTNAIQQLSGVWLDRLDQLCNQAETTQGAFHYAGSFMDEFRSLMAEALLRRCKQGSPFGLGVTEAANMIERIHDATVLVLRSRLGARNDADAMVEAIRAGSISLVPGRHDKQFMVSVIIGLSTMKLSPEEVRTIIRVFTDNGAAPEDVDFMESKWMLTIRVYDVHTQGQSPTADEEEVIRYHIIRARPEVVDHLCQSLSASPTLSWRSVLADIKVVASARFAQAKEAVRGILTSRQ